MARACIVQLAACVIMLYRSLSVLHWSVYTLSVLLWLLFVVVPLRRGWAHALWRPLRQSLGQLQAGQAQLRKQGSSEHSQAGVHGR